MSQREISAATEFDHLREGVVIRDSAGRIMELGIMVWRRYNRQIRFWLETGSGQECADSDIELPARVLWEPGQD